ncbi:MAG: XamI family restriction endonuclease [Pyrinomonadaceae bacterium]|nr:XamI family restriction endonuclease [Pyrinomonadaceae bacterium]
MPINLDKPQLWKADIVSSVDMYNRWFMAFAPKAFRQTRILTAQHVKDALNRTSNLTNISPALLIENPHVLSMLRMSTCPPIAQDRLVGLASVSKNLVTSMEDAENSRIPPRMVPAERVRQLKRIAKVIRTLADPDIFVWIDRTDAPSREEIERAATIVADRLCGAVTDPIIRNAQERRQLAAIGTWLQKKGYKSLSAGHKMKFDTMTPGTFSFRMNVPVRSLDTLGQERSVNIPIDAVIMPHKASVKDLPLLLEAKSAGDFTNVNKRRKEEAQKMSQLRATYGKGVRFGLFLCGYFDSGYLGYEAAEGIDWVWEHRIEDLAHFGLVR